MSEMKHKNFADECKASMVLEALRGIRTVNEIGEELGSIRPK